MTDTNDTAPESNTTGPESADAPLHRRGIKSYVIRAGRMTQAQQRGLEDVWPRLGLTIADGRQDLDALFGRQAPRVVEIGFGMGNTLIEQAETHPDTDFIGIEVHAPGVGKLLDEVDKRGLTNLRVYREDALAVLEQCLPEGSLTTLQLFFPDPWLKKKQRKQRSACVRGTDAHARFGGMFHMATDWEAYAEWMAEVMEAAPGYANTAPPRPRLTCLARPSARSPSLRPAAKSSATASGI